MKALATIALLVLGGSAAFGQAKAATYNLGFLSYDQKTQYCDYEQLTVTAPTAVGVHNIQAPDCSVEDQNGVMVGVQVTIPATSTLPVTGSVYALADNTGDAYIGSGGGFACGCAFLYLTKLMPATPEQLQNGGPYGWAFYYTFGGEQFLGSYGFLTKTLGSTDEKTSFGSYL
jgi:hypothetical protein